MHFAVIPDKNYFIPEEPGYPALDYAHLEQLLQSGLNKDIHYLGMTPFDSLSLDDYYRTDLHWRQECLQGVVNDLSAMLGVDACSMMNRAMEHFEILHTQSRQWIIEDIDEFIKERKA